MKRAVPVILALTLAVPCLADSIVYMRVPKPLIEEHLRPAPDSEAERVSTLRGLFQKAGCSQIAEQIVPEESSPNLTCILPGIAEGTVLVSAPLDYAGADSKSPAQWSALAALPLLVKSLVGVPHRSTFVFAAFSGREHGMRGATWYISQLSHAQRATMRAMIDLDELGRTPPVYALAQSDKTLETWLQAAASSLKLGLPPSADQSQDAHPTQADEGLWANAKPFQLEQIPAISIQSAPAALLPALHKDGSIPDRFTGAGFDVDAFDDTYRLLCVYVLYLDGNLGKPPIKVGTYAGTLLDTAGLFGTRTIEMSTKLDRFTTVAEMDRFEAILKKGGQEALADALEKANDVGSYRVGLRLATGIKLAILQKSRERPLGPGSSGAPPKERPRRRAARLPFRCGEAQRG